MMRDIYITKQLILKVLSPFNLIIVFLLINTTSYGQTGKGTISGSVKDSTGSTVPYASVYLEGTNLGSTTNGHGSFTFQNIPSGDYTLVVSSIGHETQKIRIRIAEGETKELNFQMKEDIHILEEVVITGRKPDLKENLTSSVTIVDSKRLREQEIISNNPADILAATTPGLGLSSGTSSNWGQTLRGRPILVLIDGIPQSTPLRNGSVDLRTIDPYALERIEILRGATSIYGNGGAGGIINYITKSNFHDKKIGARTEIGTTGSLVETKNSVGGRFYQSIYGKPGKFDFTTSGSYEQTGTYKDAEGDPLGPIYGLSDNEILNFFGKAGYDIGKKQRLELTYNYFSSLDKTDLVEKTGSAKNEIKTTSAQGTILGSPQGTRWDHNILLKYSNLGIIGKTNLNVSTYYQSISTVFYYSNTFEGGGQSTIQSNKKGIRLDMDSRFALGSKLSGNILYGLDILNDVTAQPLLDGRSWVPEMNMRNIAPFLQLQTKLFNDFIYNGGVRFENVNINVPDYTTLKPYNYKTGQFGSSIDVKGGELNYNNLVFNSGLKYMGIKFFKPYVNFSQGFSIADLGLALRSATVNDMAKIQTEPVIVDNYEAGFSGQWGPVNYEGATYISRSELGSGFKQVNGVFEVIRTPEKVHGFEGLIETKIGKMLTVGGTYSYVEGKRDANSNGEFDNQEDSYLGGDRISAPKYTAYLRLTPSNNFLLRLEYIGSDERSRFERNAAGSYNTYEGPVKAYNLFNLAASYKFNASTSLKIGIENLLNEDYFPARSQWIMLDSYYIKGKGTSFNLALSVEL